MRPAETMREENLSHLRLRQTGQVGIAEWIYDTRRCTRPWSSNSRCRNKRPVFSSRAESIGHQAPKGKRSVAGNHGAGLFIWSNSVTVGLRLCGGDHISSEQLVSKQVGRAVIKPAKMTMWSGRGQGRVSPCTNRSCMRCWGSAVSGRPEVTTPSQDPTRPRSRARNSTANGVSRIWPVKIRILYCHDDQEFQKANSAFYHQYRPGDLGLIAREDE